MSRWDPQVTAECYPAIVAALREHGIQSARELSVRMGISYSSMVHCTKRMQRLGLIVVAEYRKSRNGIPTLIWGIKGVHTKAQRLAAQPRRPRRRDAGSGVKAGRCISRQFVWNREW